MQHKTRLVSLLMALIISSLFTVSSFAQEDPTPTPGMSSGMSDTDGMETDTDFSADDLTPLVRGIYEGEDVLFLHTEVSDESIANLLTEMMGPTVVVVPMLAEIPQEFLGKVYVFTNGLVDGGPLGFQPDIFDSVPGDESYSPLRQIILVTWNEDSEPRQLESVEELLDAEENDELMIEESGIVVNMPILVWLDQSR